MVNKDVGGVPGEGDELSFLLTQDGQIIYSKNCRQLAVLMHVDISMPLWVFFDVYGRASVSFCPSDHENFGQCLFVDRYVAGCLLFGIRRCVSLCISLA